MSIWCKIFFAGILLNFAFQVYGVKCEEAFTGPYKGSLTSKQKEVITEIQNARYSLLHPRAENVVFSLWDIASLKETGLSLKDIGALVKPRVKNLKSYLGFDLWSQWERFKKMSKDIQKILKQPEELSAGQIRDIAFFGAAYGAMYSAYRPGKTPVNDIEWVLRQWNQAGYTKATFEVLIKSRVFLPLVQEKSLNKEIFNYISDKEAAQSVMGKTLTFDQNEALYQVQYRLLYVNKFKPSLLLDSGLTMEDIKILFEHNVLTKQGVQKKDIRNYFQKWKFDEKNKKTGGVDTEWA